jgi:hypothetical protein
LVDDLLLAVHRITKPSCTAVLRGNAVVVTLSQPKLQANATSCPCTMGPAGAPMSADKRRKWCDNPKNLEGKMFDTNNVYTFHIWQVSTGANDAITPFDGYSRQLD